jgi:hypothetical protein
VEVGGLEGSFGSNSFCLISANYLTCSLMIPPPPTNKKKKKRKQQQKQQLTLLWPC